MLARYQIVRGKRSPVNPLPDGVRIDVRKHTRHVLRPEADAVAAFLARPTGAEFEKFVRSKTNPDVGHCHTTAALRFMKAKYPRLRVRLPK